MRLRLPWRKPKADQTIPYRVRVMADLRHGYWDGSKYTVIPRTQDYGTIGSDTEWNLEIKVLWDDAGKPLREPATVRVTLKSERV